MFFYQMLKPRLFCKLSTICFVHGFDLINYLSKKNIGRNLLLNKYFKMLILGYKLKYLCEKLIRRDVTKAIIYIPA